MTELATTYMGLSLRNPLVASASPLSHTVDGIRRLVDAGVGAVVLHSLFEEELTDHARRHTWLLEAGTESFAESLYFPSLSGSEPGPRRYLSVLERAANAVGVPLIASLNGVTAGGWTSYARSMQDAGASGIELNVPGLPEELTVSGREVERRLIEIVQRVKSAVTVPVAVKLSPYFASIGEVAAQLDDAGADAIVLFSRILLPDIDIEIRRVVSNVGLSTPEEGRLPRTWIAFLHGRLRASLAASTGVESPDDVVKYLLAGADVVMTTSALLRHGPGHAAALLEGLTAWMSRKGFADVAELRGALAAPSGGDESPYGRAGYVAALRAANVSTYEPPT